MKIVCRIGMALLAGALPLCVASLPVFAQPQERGQFVLHKMEQPIGRETYTVTREASQLSIAVDFKFTDRGNSVPLMAHLRTLADLTPLAFSIHGKNARNATLDQELEINGSEVRARNLRSGPACARKNRPFPLSATPPLRCRC